MRQYTEPTARNLLRRPLILGVPFQGLILLSFGVLSLLLLSGGSRTGDSATLAVGLIGYAVLRLVARFARPGWEEAMLFPFEKLAWKKSPLLSLQIQFKPNKVEIKSPYTLDPLELVYEKEALAEVLKLLKPGESSTISFHVGLEGTSVQTICLSGHPPRNWTSEQLGQASGFDKFWVYSLSQLPVVTDPLSAFGMFSQLKPPYAVWVRTQGVEFLATKRRIEASRRRNARDSARVSNIDSDVTFEESSRVLQGLSRGDETLLEFAIVILSPIAQENLDAELFTLEKKRDLPVLSILGSRKRFHRSHLVRALTASDLLPTLMDPKEEGAQILKTVRGNPLYFSPQDPRLEALHMLVVGASGSGKSFFTGLVLKRMRDEQVPMSALFVDHNRSFRRLIRSMKGAYLEPDHLQGLGVATDQCLAQLEEAGTFAGIELSDLGLDEKKEATHLLLSRVEHFLRHRKTAHPIYLVLDECWNFLRDEPVLVQRAFREFRKLNGAVIAITQSLSDFVTNSTGQSIFQNAPTRILLRQGEDLTQFRGALGLNDIELSKLRLLRQVKGSFSECLIKTPFLSRIGRLYPTEAENALLRTDNLRAELIEEARALLRTGKEAP